MHDGPFPYLLTLLTSPAKDLATCLFPSSWISILGCWEL